MSRALLRSAGVLIGLLFAWHLVVLATAVPAFILPPPGRVLLTLWERRALIADHASITLVEIVLGLMLGVGFGAATALALAAFAAARRWLLPVLVASQALPVFALAPLLVLWVGYGLASKVAMATLIIYFPVTVAFYDGLRRTPTGWLDLAQVMGGTPASVLRHVRLPAALPAFASGLRVAAAVAPIGAVIGEWVGSSAGLGYVMLHANGRMQIDLLFAALLALMLMAVVLYAVIDRLLRRALPWQPDSEPAFQED